MRGEYDGPGRHIASRPQDDVEVEHARAPRRPPCGRTRARSTAARPAVGRAQGRVHKRGRVGEGAAGRAKRRRCRIAETRSTRPSLRAPDGGRTTPPGRHGGRGDGSSRARSHSLSSRPELREGASPPPRRSHDARKPGSGSRGAGNCPLCRASCVARGAAFGLSDWWNAPVRAFGDRDAWLGIAPGAGHVRSEQHRPPVHRRLCGLLLYETLRNTACGGCLCREDRRQPRLNGCVILNYGQVLPPGNKPVPRRSRHCRRYYEAALGALRNGARVVARARSTWIGGADRRRKAVAYKFGTSPRSPPRRPPPDR